MMWWIVTFALFGAFGIPGRTAIAASSGPDPGQCGVPASMTAPAEPTCTSCHATYPLNPDRHGSIELIGLPQAGYTPGETYTLTLVLRHEDTSLTRWGFQLTAVEEGTLRGAGSFGILEAETTQVLEGPREGRRYLEHSYGGTGIGRSGEMRWSFAWTAPRNAQPVVLFFGAGNVANMDGSKEGDRIYSPSPRPLARVTPSASAAAPVR